MRTLSSPPPASTSTAVKVLRSKVRVVVSLTTTVSVVGSGARRMLSLAPSPLSWSVPAWMREVYVGARLPGREAERRGERRADRYSERERPAARRVVVGGHREFPLW